MKRAVVAFLCLTAAMSVAAAQVPPTPRLELRPFGGWFTPTGSQSDDFKSSAMFGMQAAVELTHHFHVLGSVGWTDGRSKIAALTNAQTFIWQYDVGAEANSLHEMGYDWLFRPFVGVGAGARTYQYESTGIGNRTCAAGYGSLGTEFQKAAVAFRFETRGYVNCFKQPFTGQNYNRSDAMFAFGLAYHVF
jgi:hypothetical protein